jgi:parvulin-like peptidyl-prolyl isomerase
LSNRNEFIKIAVTKEEKARYKEFAKKVYNSDYHLSEFIRGAVREKIHRIENPELFRSNNQVDPVMIEKLNKNSKLLQELKQRDLESEELYNELKDTLGLISNYTVKPSKSEKENIISLFKGFNKLSQQDLLRKTNLNKKELFSLLTELREQNIIRLIPTGEFVLDD